MPMLGWEACAIPAHTPVPAGVEGRDLGGDLVLEAGGSGACFRLTLRDCQ